MEILGLFLLSFAVSIDGFAMGVTFGLRDMRLPHIIINNCLGLQCSGFICHAGGASPWQYPICAINPQLGCTNTYSCWGLGFINHLPSPGKRGYPGQVNLSFRAFGFVVQIIREQCGRTWINRGQLASVRPFSWAWPGLDALGAGFGASLAGYSPFGPPA